MLTRRLLPVLAVVCAVAALVGLVLGTSAKRILLEPAIPVVPFGVVGALLGVLRPRHPISWLLIGIGAGPALTAAVTLVSPGFDYSAELQNGLLVGGLAVLLVLFPTGAPPARWWIVPMGLVLVSWIGISNLGLVAFAGGFELPVGVVVAAASLAVCVTAPIVRFRRSSGVERSQLRWLGAAAGLIVAAMVTTAIGLALEIAALTGFGGSVVILGVGVGLPGAILIAILRYRLYEIGRIVSRTVTYTVVAVVVAAVYAIPVLVMPQLLGSSSDLVTAGSTLAAAAAFNPVRRWAQRHVERRFNRSAYDSRREVDRLTAALRDSTDHGEIATGLARAAGDSLHPASLAVWLRTG